MTGNLLVALAFVALGSTDPRPAPSYFPPGVFSGDPGADEAARRVLGKYLAAAGEPSLLDVSTANPEEEYRLFWVPAFEPPVIVRFTRSDGRFTQTVVRWGNAESENGPFHSTSAIGESDWKRMRCYFREASFWSDMRNAPREPDIIVIDSSYWILEGRRGGEYKVIHRAPPDVDEDRAFVHLSKRLLEHAGLDLDELGLTD